MKMPDDSRIRVFGGGLHVGPILVRVPASDGFGSLSPEAAGGGVRIGDPAPASFGDVIGRIVTRSSGPSEGSGAPASSSPPAVVQALKEVVNGGAGRPQAPLTPEQITEREIAGEDALIEGVVDRMALGAVRVIEDLKSAADSVRPLQKSVYRILFEHHTAQSVTDTEVRSLRDRIRHRTDHVSRDRLLHSVRTRASTHIAAARAAATRIRLGRVG